MRRSILIAVMLWIHATGSFAQKEVVTVISGSTVLDGTGGPPLSNATIIIVGDRIAEVGPSKSVKIPRGARLIDATRKFVLPGLIDTHVHLEMVGLADVGELPAIWNTQAKLHQLVADNAKLDLISGITTVRDLGSSNEALEVRNEINAGKAIGPRIIAAGMQLVKKSKDAPSQKIFLEYDGVESAQATVQQLAAMGAGVIKIRLTHMRPVPSLEEVRAIVDEAHHRGLRATVHTDVPADDLVELAIKARADGIEHNAPLRSRDPDVLIQMAERHMSLMAGAGAFYVQRIDSSNLIDIFDEAQGHLYPPDIVAALHAGIDSLHRQTQEMKRTGWSAAQRQTRFIEEIQRARKAGVLLVFGTDCGAYGMIHGEQYKALFGESQMGSSPMEAILMATRDAALSLGKANELGTIEPGKLADMIILNANPLADLRNLHRVFRVIKGGIVVNPAELISSSKP